jgi:hypothetical protein
MKNKKVFKIYDKTIKKLVKNPTLLNKFVTIEKGNNKFINEDYDSCLGIYTYHAIPIIQNKNLDTLQIVLLNT